MCLVCASAAAPEVAVIVGGYAAARFGRPVSRLRAALGRGPGTEPIGDERTEHKAEARDRVPVTPVP